MYGYEITEQLSNYGLDMVAQGTIYPLLLKLEKENLVTSYLRESNFGPPRKYYSITKNGEEYINSFKNVWGNISTTITKIAIPNLLTFVCLYNNTMKRNTI